MTTQQTTADGRRSCGECGHPMIVSPVAGSAGGAHHDHRCETTECGVNFVRVFASGFPYLIYRDDSSN